VTLRGETDRRDRPQALPRRLGDGQRINERRAAILDHGVGITFGVNAVVQDEPPPNSRDDFLNAPGSRAWFRHTFLLGAADGDRVLALVTVNVTGDEHPWARYMPFAKDLQEGALSCFGFVSPDTWESGNEGGERCAPPQPRGRVR
jgi:hypothetical protein